MAEDIAVSLLAQYYGISEESEIKKCPSIQECVGSIENDSDKLIGEQSTVDTNDDDTSKETEVQVRIFFIIINKMDLFFINNSDNVCNYLFKQDNRSNRYFIISEEHTKLSFIKRFQSIKN